MKTILSCTISIDIDDGDDDDEEQDAQDVESEDIYKSIDVAVICAKSATTREKSPNVSYGFKVVCDFTF